jgi:hypothetical protein
VKGKPAPLEVKKKIVPSYCAEALANAREPAVSPAGRVTDADWV